MGSKTFDGVRFAAYTDDHVPPHVHGSYAGVVVIVELRKGKTRLSRRRDAVTPLSGKRSDVKHVLSVAEKNVAALNEIWRAARG